MRKLGIASPTASGRRGSDYEWTYYTPGSRASVGPATATIIFHDDAGRTDTLTTEGPITAGGLPSTYPPEETSHEEYFNGSAGCQPLWGLKTGTSTSTAPSPRHIEVPRSETPAAGKAE